ncbi:MAG: type I-MYXAN CRISPR-associated protein Cas6/Cmx6 [Gammaproteobacteria bacterium]|nr:type I-MYXAN CRISPR-associated protein Cas6/Cmx6 [Gammaproteobacteria bacterium]
MLWQDEKENTPYQIPDDVVDLSFSISCTSIPVDNAYALSSAIIAILPWFSNEPEAGLHIIQGGPSINGWQRPETEDATLLLSKRSKLRLRLPKHRVEDAEQLCGKLLDVSGYNIEVGRFKTLLLGNTDTLLSRHIVSAIEEDETEFTERMLQELRGMGLELTKILSGRDHALAGPDGPINTKSLLVSGMTAEDAVTLQAKGIGPGRSMGFGLFIASKSL